MSVEAKRFRHRAIAIHQVPVGNVVAAGAGQQGAQPQQPEHQSLIQALIGDCGLQFLHGGPDIELGFHLARAHWGHAMPPNRHQPALPGR
jgi:RimJ/RimL family protein N-acetyltransferase